MINTNQIINLDLATDVYIKHMDGSPCERTSIKLYKGADFHHYWRSCTILLNYVPEEL